LKRFIDEYKESKNFMPAPNKYKNLDYNPITKTYKLSKLKKITFTEEVMMKKKNLPSPDKYNTTRKYKILGTYK
jgi:hypothetical protein